MRIDIIIPEKWDDLTEWQHNRIGWILFNKLFQGEFFKYAILMVLLTPKPTFKNAVKIFYLLSRVPLEDLLQYTDFVFDSEAILTRFRPYYKVKSGFKKVNIYGPSQRLANISILELSYADTFFYNWITEGKDIDLHRLCAVLYRPLNSPFSESNLVANSKLTDTIPLHQKYMIALAYQGSRTVFIKRYPHVFPKSKSQEKKPKKGKKAYHPFTSVINAMVMDEVQPFGPLDKAEQANANKFLEIFNEMLLRQKRQKTKK
ncbi:hypothetical protein [Flavobacterium beibuense]|uniref:hypothetical protein n=1 Tax=Flavobacterium beibuense TaxID=657326 RepID=UPI003A9244EE